jgi:hypothetical protein
MNKLHLTLAALSLSLSLAQTAFAGTTVPIDGGGATGFTLGEPVAVGAPRSRAEVAAEGQIAARNLDSRSGQQADAESRLNVTVTSTRTRDQVRDEGIAFSRRPRPEVYEGGQAGTEFAQAPDQTAPVLAASRGRSAG